MSGILGIKSYAKSDLPDYVSVGNYSSIAERCYFHGRSDNHYCVENPRAVCTTNALPQGDKGPIVIGHDVWVGLGANILSGVKIGNGAIIAAWSVVTKDVPSFCMVAGNPARIKKHRFSPSVIAKLEEIKWWDWPESLFDERKEDFRDVDLFIKKYG